MNRKLAFFAACLSPLFFALFLPMGNFFSVIIIALLVLFSGLRYGFLATVFSALFSALPFTTDNLGLMISSLMILKLTPDFVLLIVSVLAVVIQFGLAWLVAKLLRRLWFTGRSMSTRFEA